MIELKKDLEYGFEYDETAVLYCYLNKSIRTIGRRHRKALIICPGGGFDFIDEREGFPVASRFMGYGLQSFVLRYKTGKKAYRIALHELQDVIALVRTNSKRWDVDSDSIAVMGFSVGAFLGLGLASHRYTTDGYYGMDRPNALLLGYPVVTAKEVYAHEPSINNAVDDIVKRSQCSMEEYVTEDFPPVFLWANADDEDVDINNTMLLGNQLVKKHVPFTMHIFMRGGHGLSLGDDCSARVLGQVNSSYSVWVPMALNWLEETL